MTTSEGQPKLHLEKSEAEKVDVTIPDNAAFVDKTEVQFVENILPADERDYGDTAVRHASERSGISGMMKNNEAKPWYRRKTVIAAGAISAAGVAIVGQQFTAAVDQVDQITSFPNSEPRLTSVPVVGQDFFETNTIQVPARASAEAPIITPESNSILEENAAIFKQRSGSAEKSFIQEVSSRGENYDRGAGLEYNPGKESDDAQTILFQLAIKHEVIIAEQDPELREQLLESYADSSTVIYDRVKPTSANFVPTADLVISETPTYYTDNFADVPADGSPTKAIVAYNLIAEPTETGRVDTFAYVVKLVNEDWKIMKLLKPQDSAASKSLIDKIDNSASYTWE